MVGERGYKKNTEILGPHTGPLHTGGPPLLCRTTSTKTASLPPPGPLTLLLPEVGQSRLPPIWPKSARQSWPKLATEGWPDLVGQHGSRPVRLGRERLRPALTPHEISADFRPAIWPTFGKFCCSECLRPFLPLLVSSRENLVV